MSIRFPSPLRYPGGKGRIDNYFRLVFRYNDLLDGHYVEPYAGGAGLALALLFGECVSHVHFNDISKPVYAFWHSVLYETDALCARILFTQVDMEEWYRQKALRERPDDVSLLDLGFSTFFLNRTNRSGILGGGVIGGKRQTGRYKLGARYNKGELVQRIERIARYRSRISIYNKDAADFMEAILPILPEKTLFYLDPPYYVKGKGLYEDYYEHRDHLMMSKLVSTLKHKWIVSYDDTPAIREMYKNYQHITYSLSYSAADRYRGAEIMFFSDALEIPPVKNPAKVSRKMLLEVVVTP